MNNYCVPGTILDSDQESKVNQGYVLLKSPKSDINIHTINVYIYIQSRTNAELSGT